MKDPVILPSSRISVDRAVIQRHLLSDTVSSSRCYFFFFLTPDNFSGWVGLNKFVSICLLQTDPFNRSHLTQDMLIPDVELKAKIEEFIKSQGLKRQRQLNSTANTKEALDSSNDATPMFID